VQGVLNRDLQRVGGHAMDRSNFKWSWNIISIILRPAGPPSLYVRHNWWLADAAATDVAAAFADALRVIHEEARAHSAMDTAYSFLNVYLSDAVGHPSTENEAD
jgi:hypothetical protein